MTKYQEEEDNAIMTNFPKLSILVVLLASVIFFESCRGLSNDYGNFSITMPGNSTRGVYHSSDVSYFTLDVTEFYAQDDELQGESKETFYIVKEKKLLPGETYTVRNIEEGTYRVEVLAYRDSAGTSSNDICIGSGNTEVSVAIGQTAKANIVMSLYSYTERFVSSESEFRSALENCSADTIIYLAADINIRSDISASISTTVDGQGRYHIKATNCTVSFGNIIFRNGLNETGFGGALNLEDAPATLTNCSFINNSAYCAAINIAGWSTGGTTTITGCKFEGNKIIGTDNSGKKDINASGEYTVLVFGGGNSSNNGTSGIFIQPEVNHNSGTYQGTF